MTMLETLSDRRDLILLAEIGVLIHDLGKLSKEFIAVKAIKSPRGPGWWESDVHAEVAGLHSSCVMPASLALYFTMASQTVDMDVVRRRGTKAICDTICAELAGIGGDLCDVLVKRIEELLGKVTSVGGVTSKFGQLRQQLEAAIRDRQYRKEQAVQAMAKLDLAWGKIETARQEFLGELKPLQEHESRLSREQQVSDDFLSETLRQALMTELTLVGETVRLKDFLELHHRGHWQIPWLLHLLRAAAPEREDEETQTAKGEPEGCDGLDSALDKQLGRKEGNPQEFGQTFVATAFGYEAQRLLVGLDEDGLKPVRHKFARVLAEELGKVKDGQATPAQVRPHIFAEAEIAFRQALGETRRAANDVTLWDHCYSVASLYKAALAKVLIEGKWTEPKEIGWRFLWVGVDGLRFFAQAHHVTDMLGRRQSLMDALNQVRDALEVDYPLGNEVYRDENGSIFVMPGVNDEIHEKLSGELKELVLETFRQTGVGGELVPRVTWNKHGPVREKMVSDFGELATRDLSPAGPDPKALGNWWQGVQSEGKEICTVCGVRPIGYGVPELYGPGKERVDYYLEAAEERKICGPCLERRSGRSKAWATNADGSFGQTVWTDEVADDNGRLALVVGRFGLEGWLDGKLVSTMLVNPTDSKNPSPARIRRCWETTRKFWLDVQQQILLGKVEQRFRLGIRPANVPAINHPGRGLGRWHTYEADINGRRLGLCWHPTDETTADRNLFWTIDNLRYLGRQLSFKEEALKTDDNLQAAFLTYINGKTLTLYEPGGYLGQERRANADAETCLVVEKKHFRPFIPLLAEPATFMALVPASAALDIVQAIKEKYDIEMARVRDRLPLHLGLVFAPRRTPLAAVLEAGQAMLKMPDTWQEWQVTGKEIIEKTLDDGDKAPDKTVLRLRTPSSRLQPALLSRPDDSLLGETVTGVHWSYPLIVGDDKTSDNWYPHLLTREPAKDEDLAASRPWKHICELDLGDGVCVRPSRFDFIFLDTTARRFEIHYGDNGHRSRRTRPFLLDDLDRLEELWEQLRSLKTSQRHQIIATIEATREAWFGADRKGKSLTDSVFRQFVRDTLAGAAWPEQHRWSKMDKTLQKRLEDAGVSGELADLAELHMHILKE